MPVYEEMVRRGLEKRYKLIWLNKNYQHVFLDGSIQTTVEQMPYYKIALERLRIKNRTKAVIFGNRFVFSDTPGVKHFYITHGAPVKNTKGYYPAPKYAEYMFTLGPGLNQEYQEQSCLPMEKIVPLGYPRNDILAKSTIDIKSILGTACTKIVVWYPTYRQHKSGYSHTDSTISMPLIHDAEIAKQLNDAAKKYNTMIVIKPHFAQDISLIEMLKLSNIRFIDDDFFPDNHISSYQFVGSCDALLTDYSSVYYDFLLCDKPIGVVWEDYQEFSENPGFAIDPNYIFKAATKIYTLDDMIDFIKAVADGNDKLQTERKEICDYVHYSRDGKSTERVVDFILEKLESKV